MRNREQELLDFQKAIFEFINDNDWTVKNIQFQTTTTEYDYWSAFGTCYTKEFTSSQDFYITYENNTLNIL